LNGPAAEPKTLSTDAEPLHVGIDLGTSRSAISSANGVRTSIPSFVGYARDVVSRKLLGKDVLYGQEALDHRLSVDLHRPLEKGVLKYSESEAGGGGDDQSRAAKDLINELIRLSEPEEGQKIFAVIGAPAQASIRNKEAILDAARECVDAVILCSEPFAVAYGLDMLQDALVVDIGAGTVDLCRMHGTMPEESDQLTLTTAGDHIDQRLMQVIAERHPEAQFTIGMVKELKERNASVSDAMDRALCELPVEGKPTPFDLTDPIRDCCREIVPPIVEGLAKLISSFDPEFQTRLKNRVLLAGGGSQIKGLDVVLEQQMRERLGAGRVQRVEEPLFGGSNGALKIAQDMPLDLWEQMR
jgi:rod shape-determining protein MreB